MARSRRSIVLVGLVAWVLSSATAQAQYFGGNKVQYRTFDFEVLKTQHFDIYYYPEEKEAIQEAARMAERAYARLSKVLDHRFTERQPIILYASQPHFQQTNAISGDLGEGTGGVTEALKRRVVMPSAGSLAQTDHVLAHEMVHAFQYDMTTRSGPGGGGIPGALRLPLWFIEGMAEYLSVGPEDPHTAMWIRDATRQEKLPTIKQLNNPKYFPYRFGQAFWAYVGGKYGDAVIGRMLRVAGRSGNAEATIKEVLGVTPVELSKQWHDSIRAGYRIVLDSKKPPSAGARAIVTEKTAGELNVSPALSPDGKRVVFLSEKDLFSIDLYLADADTGKVLKKLTSTATDPHFESLQFIQSAGSWSPRGDRFALGTITKGRAYLTVIDPETGRVLKEVPQKDVDEIFDPAWSPDGKSLVFSAMQGGRLDLFTCDLDSGASRRLTDDLFGDFQPAWSPDGKTIAFSTDRFTTKLQDLEYAGYGIALYDLDSGQVRPGPGFSGAKNISPQWSKDGSAIYFLADRLGITNVYRAAVVGGDAEQLTDVSTGVSGITALSPSLTVARSTDRVMFSAREDGKYRLYALGESAPTLAVVRNESPATGSGAGLLPPVEGRKPSSAERYEAPLLYEGKNPARGEEYKPKLTLDNLGQGTTIAAGVDRFGSVVAGGTSLYFSDMLGDRNLGLDIFAQAGSFEDVGARVAYGNLRRRNNWVVGAERIPYLTGASFAPVRGTVGGRPAIIEETFLERQTSTAVFGITAYPFNRAERIELGASARRLSLTRELRTQAYDLITGEFLGEDRQKLPGPKGLNLGEASAAFVHDTSVFAATSPIVGSRYRLEVSQTSGSVNFTGLLADYRRYVMPVKPYTLAFRALHYGRYGGGGEDLRLPSLFLGYPTLVRGYDSGSFRSNECVPTAASTCPIFDRLLGSRMIVGNAELRFPPFGAATGRVRYGPVPFEIAFFADAGVAWTRASGDSPSLFGGERKGIASIGTAGRLNLFGYAVLELDFARPLSRPGRGWLWQFHISPGGF